MTAPVVLDAQATHWQRWITSAPSLYSVTLVTTQSGQDYAMCKIPSVCSYSVSSMKRQKTHL